MANEKQWDDNADKRMKELEKEWDVEKNAKRFEGVTPGSNYKAHWICAAGHEWEASVKSRVQGRGCPICAGRIAMTGVNDLLTRFPNVAREWDYEKNEEVGPDKVLPFSHKRVWWICKNGHSWKASIADRTRGSGCPMCSGYVVAAYARSHRAEQNTKYIDAHSVRVNKDLLCNYEIASEWNYEKNKVSTPMDYAAKSGKKVWWKCKNGHEWEASIISRVQKKTKCPYCAGRKVISGLNDLKTLYPEIADYWNVEKNTISANQVSPMSHKKVFWTCTSCGKVWEATVSSMHYKADVLCPYCNKDKCHKRSEENG